MLGLWSGCQVYTVTVAISGLETRMSYPASAESREMWLYRLEQMIARALGDSSLL